ncbi:hypothetical protein [Psychroserpens sp.]|uniref:hypothetical protein n=1 Tax=Psychroserpens sp. TaxID=2020870 RepID=UPI002B2714FD|nr:hypothetical protein [Psychroserpens sp.]
MKTDLKRYGITEKKKSELDALKIKVLNAQHKVEQFEAIVTSLTEKSEMFEQFYAAATTNRETALNNKKLVDEVIQNARNLAQNSTIAYDEIVAADTKMEAVASHFKTVIDELIYSAEIINKLATTVIRKKAQNELISDELISMIGTAGKDANNAVAVSLVALESTFTAQASNIQSEAAASLQYPKSYKLLGVLTGRKFNGSKTEDHESSIEYQLNQAYNNAQLDYAKAKKANNDAISELGKATIMLNKAEIKLSSLVAGNQAAIAAALAS